MNRKFIADLAVEVGFDRAYASEDAAISLLTLLERFAKHIASSERERAALKVEELGMIGYGTLAIAAAIRKGDQE